MGRHARRQEGEEPGGEEKEEEEAEEEEYEKEVGERGEGQARCARVISDFLPLPPIPYHGVDLLSIRIVGCRARQ